MLGSVLWTTTLALAVYATAADLLALMMWAVIAGHIACIVTGGVIAVCAVDRGRLQVGEIARLLSMPKREPDLPRPRR
jgi:hypothetical protein